MCLVMVIAAALGYYGLQSGRRRDEMEKLLAHSKEQLKEAWDLQEK